MAATNGPGCSVRRGCVPGLCAASNLDYAETGPSRRFSAQPAALLHAPGAGVAGCHTAGQSFSHRDDHQQHAAMAERPLRTLAAGDAATLRAGVDLRALQLLLRAARAAQAGDPAAGRPRRFTGPTRASFGAGTDREQSETRHAYPGRAGRWCAAVWRIDGFLRAPHRFSRCYL